jgi:transcriptional regulator of acetoin/glycerol metabolism
MGGVQMTTREKKRRARQRSRSHALIIKERQRRRAASLDQALGWRIDEWVALTGVSRPTVWRQHRDHKLKIIYVDKIPFVPRTEAIRLGFINE